MVRDSRGADIAHPEVSLSVGARLTAGTHKPWIEVIRQQHMRHLAARCSSVALVVIPLTFLDAFLDCMRLPPTPPPSGLSVTQPMLLPNLCHFGRANKEPNPSNGARNPTPQPNPSTSREKQSHTRCPSGRCPSRLAVMHLNGIGTVRNCKMAVELLKRAGEPIPSERVPKRGPSQGAI